MGVPSTLLFSVINKFAAQLDENQRRFQNFVSFLGLNREKDTQKTSPQEKEAAERAVGDVRKMIRDWFFGTKREPGILTNKLRAGYFSEKNRAQHPWRQEAYLHLPKMLYDKLRYAILRHVADYASKELGHNIRVDDLNVTDEAVGEKVIDLLGELQRNNSFFGDAINRWLKQTGGVKEKTPEAEVDEAKSRGRKEYQPGMAETWFRPRVTEDVYDKYEAYVKKHQNDQFKNVLERVRAETGRENLVPEDIGIRKNRVDPNAFRILSDLGKFNLEVFDVEPAYDSKANAETWQITFSIPELTEKMPSVYGDALYTMKIPPSVRSLDPNDKIPVSIQHSYNNPKSGKAGFSLRLDETFEDWTEDTMDTLNDVGFVSKKRFEDFVSSLTSLFKDKWRRGKTLDDLVADLGGEARFHGKSFATADDLADLADQLGGTPLTKEELQSQREMGQFEDRMQHVKKLTDDAIDAVGDKIQKYYLGIEKQDGAAMREAIVDAARSTGAASLSDLTQKIRSGNDIKIGWDALFRTTELINKALEFVFHPQVSPGEYAWKTHLFNYLTSEGANDPEVIKLAKWLLYKDRLKATGKKGEALRNALMNTSATELSNSIPTQEAQRVFVDKMKAVQQHGEAMTRLQRYLRDLVETKLTTHPSFRKFWERQRTWDAAIKPGVETEVERIMMGDEPIPRSVKLPSNLKKQLVETVEIPGRGGKVKKEQRIDLSGLQMGDPTAYSDFEKAKEQLEKDPTDAEAKATYQQAKDRYEQSQAATKSSGELATFVSGLVDELVTKRLQQAWRKERKASASFVKLAYTKMN